jgi:hypothetical protein
MKRWLIESGDMLRFVHGETPEAAMEAALRAETAREEDWHLGRIASIVEVTEQADICYMGTEGVLRTIGLVPAEAQP